MNGPLPALCWSSQARAVSVVAASVASVPPWAFSVAALADGKERRGQQEEPVRIERGQLDRDLVGPLFSTDCTPSWNHDAGPFRYFWRFSENTTSSGVADVPSENLMFGLSWNT